MLKLRAIVTSKCIYVSDVNKPNYSDSVIFSYKFNGKKLEKTYSDEWGKITNNIFPLKITSSIARPNINARFVLIDKSLVCDKIPLEIPKNIFCTDNTIELEVKKEFEHLSSLYTLKYDTQEPEEIEIEYKIVEKIVLDEEIDFKSFRIPSFKKIGYNSEVYCVSEKDLEYSIIDRIVLPDLLLPFRPCKLSSTDSYNIIRHYVKTNLDNEVAELTSDYDFCFAVSKKIELCEPEKYKADVSPLRSKKPKYEFKYRKTRSIQVFEMTHSPENYKGYTPIKPFEGNTAEDLKKNIKDFCEKLIKEINEPLKDCPHCNGYGVILKKKD